MLLSLTVQDDSDSLIINLSRLTQVSCTREPPHDKTNKITVRSAKAQISLGIHPV